MIQSCEQLRLKRPKPVLNFAAKVFSDNHNFGLLVSPETRERSMRRFYNRMQSRVHGRNWNRRDTDQPMIAVGFWEHLDSNPHCHVLISASDDESAWLFGEGN